MKNDFSKWTKLAYYWLTEAVAVIFNYNEINPKSLHAKLNEKIKSIEKQWMLGRYAEKALYAERELFR